MRYVITGNGILALTTAFRLTQRIDEGDEVIIIGPTERPGAATLAAAAMLNSFAEISAYSLRSDQDRYHFTLSRQAAKEWPMFEQELVHAVTQFAPEAGIDTLSRGERDRGTYMINNNAADEWDDRNFDAVLKALKDFQEPHELVKPTDIPNYVPAQHLRASRAVYIPEEGWFNPRLIVHALDVVLQGHTNVRRIDATALRFHANGGTVSDVELKNGERIEGDVFLLANGASAGGLLERSALGIHTQPVFFGEGYSLEICAEGHPHERCIRTTNRGGACGIYSVPLFLGAGQREDHIVIGASNRVVNTPEFHGRLGSIERLLQGAIHEINEFFYAARLIRVNVGWRPTTQDTYPLLGGTSVRNFFIATGTKRDGFHLSPVLSATLASMMMGDAVNEEFTMFAPERPVIRDLPRHDAIDMIVSSLMSEQYQHGYSPSTILMDRQVRETYRKNIEKLHDDIGATDWGIPPELVNMYRQGYAR